MRSFLNYIIGVSVGNNFLSPLRVLCVRHWESHTNPEKVASYEKSCQIAARRYRFLMKKDKNPEASYTLEELEEV